MNTETVNKTDWFISTPNGHDIPAIGISDENYNIADVYFDGYSKKESKKFAELIVTAVNACKEINSSNPLKVAIGLPRLFEVLEKVITDDRLPFALYNDLSAIVDTLKSEF